jgi:hypothetical protein
VLRASAVESRWPEVAPLLARVADSFDASDLRSPGDAA